MIHFQANGKRHVDRKENGESAFRFRERVRIRVSGGVSA